MLITCTDPKKNNNIFNCALLARVIVLTKVTCGHRTNTQKNYNNNNNQT